MIEKRYQVFVSSTYRDLPEERQQVIQALLELDCIPAGMELFPASDETKWELIRRVIDDCDYYIVIVAGRYGSTDEEGVSYTEREYDHAVARGLPVLPFLHRDPSLIPAGRSELQADARAKLDAFRKKVERRMCKYWASPEELGSVVSRSLIQMIKARPGEGWVRARYASSPDQINELRARIEELTKELDEARFAPPPQAEGLAKGAERFKIRFSCETLDMWSDNHLVLTWDEILATVGPVMFDEASERTIRELLVDRIKWEHESELVRNFKISQEDFQTIKVQLFALGLIQKSRRKRGVRDTQTYWTLTKYGEHYLTALKAIRA